MRSTVSIKGMALALVIFFIGASLLCYLFLYRPRSIKAMKETRETASLERKLEEKDQELKKIEGEIEANKEGGTRDYFNRHQIPPKEREATFLEILDELVNRLDVKTEKVKPEPTQETPEYIRYPFLVETKSKYEEIAKFVDSLENSLGLNVDDLNIRNDPKDPLLHRLKFTVSTFELKETEPSPPPETPDQQGPSIHVDVRDDIVLKRDPFLEKEEKRKIIPPEPKPKKRWARRPRLKLNGIIHIGRTNVAIINDTVLREGDWILKHRIVRIDEDKVILEYRGEERVLKIEGLVKTKKG
jgi:Tfp pilus assembly protein PilO